jgi:PilZ domain
MAEQDLIKQAIERRRDARRSTQHRRGIIKFGPKGTDLPCTILDLTSQGAGLSVGSTFGLPQSFWLTLDGEHRDRYCKVVWVDRTRLGVKFE